MVSDNGKGRDQSATGAEPAVIRRLTMTGGMTSINRSRGCALQTVRDRIYRPRSVSLGWLPGSVVVAVVVVGSQRRCSLLALALKAPPPTGPSYLIASPHFSSRRALLNEKSVWLRRIHGQLTLLHIVLPIHLFFFFLKQVWLISFPKRTSL